MAIVQSNVHHAPPWICRDWESSPSCCAMQLTQNQSLPAVDHIPAPGIMALFLQRRYVIHGTAMVLGKKAACHIGRQVLQYCLLLEAISVFRQTRKHSSHNTKCSACPQQRSNQSARIGQAILLEVASGGPGMPSGLHPQIAPLQCVCNTP